MPDFLHSIVGVLGAVFLFGFAVLIHELGHFVAAKVFGVGVSKFAIGFGPVIAAFTRGETEYSIRWIPFGGFVALKGMLDVAEPQEAEAAPSPEEPQETSEQPGDTPVESEPDPASTDAQPSNPVQGGGMTEDLDALRGKHPLVRIVVFGAGVTCNYIVAMVFMFVLLLYGGPKQPDRPNVIERVPETSRLHDLGWRSGDVILALRTEPVSGLGTILADSDMGDALFESEPFTTWGDVVGGISEHLAPGPRYRTIAYLKSKVLPAQQPPPPVTFLMSVERAGQRLTLPFPEELLADSEELTYFSPPESAFIAGIVPGSPAHQARLVKADYAEGEEIRPYPMWDDMKPFSLAVGDRILSLNGQPADTFLETLELLRANPNAQVTLAILRETDQRTYLVTTMLERNEERPERGQLGIHLAAGVLGGEREGSSVGRALVRAPMATFELTDRILYGTVELFATSSGREIRRNLGGPLAIGIMAYKSAKRGIGDYLSLFVAISIILAVMNLLPIPILDGGYIMITAIEGLTGRRLPEKVLVPLLSVFFVLFMLLFAFLFYNDIMSWVLKIGS